MRAGGQAGKAGRWADGQAGRRAGGQEGRQEISQSYNTV